MDQNIPANEPKLPYTASELHQMNLLDVSDLLGRGQLAPERLRKETLEGCVAIFKIKGYSNLEIEKIINKDKRTVCRYIAEIRKQNSIVSDPDFQSEYIGEMTQFIDAQCQRLIKLSYSAEIGPQEQTRTIVAACQLKKYQADLLMDLGYLNRDLTRAAINDYINGKGKKAGTVADALSSSEGEVEELSNEQIHSLVLSRKDWEKRFESEVGKEIKKAREENAKKEKEEREKEVKERADELAKRAQLRKDAAIKRLEQGPES